MKMRHPAIACSLFALTACSETAVPSAPLAGGTPPPPPLSVKSSGAITGFGSIIVNGEHYEIDADTVVAFEDETETRGDDGRLRLGMRVDIDADDTDGVRVARRVEYDEELRGPADNVTPNADNPELGTFSIAGQTVIVDANTVLDDDIGDNDAVDGVDIRDLDPANLPGGDPMVVEVSGYPTEDGVIATRVERVDADVDDIGRVGVDGDEIEVKGYVDDVADNGSSITLNGAVFLIVANTVLDEGIVINDELIGAFVEIKADIDAAGDYIAVRVEAEDDLDGAEEDDEVEFEGVLQEVDTIADPDVIVVNGVTIRVDDASAFVGRVGARVALVGSFDDDEILIIRESHIEVENTVGSIDRIASIDVAAGSFTTRLGLVVTPTTMSRVEDEIGEDGDQLTPAAFLARLRNNDFIEARGYPNDAGDIIWTRIERGERERQDCVLRGPIDAGTIDDPTFGGVGVRVDTTGLGDDRFKGPDETSIGRAEFFAAAMAGDIVGVRSDEAGTGCRNGELSTMTDGKVSFEPEDDVEGTRPPEDDNGEDPVGGADGEDEIAGTIRELNAEANTFEIGDFLITVTPDTLFDSVLVGRARGEEVEEGEYPLAQIPETLDQLLGNGDVVVVVVDAEGHALLILDA